MTWASPLLAFTSCWLTIDLLLRRGRLPMDRPNARSLHAVPTPRIGGLGLVAGIVAASVFLADDGLWPPLLGAFFLAVVSWLDDLRGLPVTIRFLAHFVAAAGCLLALGVSGWMLIAATLATVWMTNLYNFMDGADGLAGGMAAIGFGALALEAWLAGAPGLATLCASIAAAALAFLRFNFPPSRLFMGDAGSIPLGFLAATIGFSGVRQGVWSWTFPLLVFSPFIADASVTLVRRALRGEKIWHAHRSHYYQRVVLMGATHRQLAVVAWGLMLVVAALAFVMHARPSSTPYVLILSAMLYASLFLAIDRRWQARRDEP